MIINVESSSLENELHATELESIISTVDRYFEETKSLSCSTLPYKKESK